MGGLVQRLGMPCDAGRCMDVTLCACCCAFWLTGSRSERRIRRPSVLGGHWDHRTALGVRGVRVERVYVKTTHSVRHAYGF